MKTATVKGRRPSPAARIAGVDKDTMKALVEIFKSLSDESRLTILMLLARNGELHVSAICRELDQSQPAVSHHLTQLKNARLVDSRREGKFSFYSLSSDLVADLITRFYPHAASSQQKLAYGELEVTFKAR
jgi:ArsR family transcriptional regulator, arsenate/arsenite/antimonite-responsive transcriptional repressor